MAGHPPQRSGVGCPPKPWRRRTMQASAASGGAPAHAAPPCYQGEKQGQQKTRRRAECVQGPPRKAFARSRAFGQDEEQGRPGSNSSVHVLSGRRGTPGKTAGPRRRRRGRRERQPDRGGGGAGAGRGAGMAGGPLPGSSFTMSKSRVPLAEGVPRHLEHIVNGLSSPPLWPPAARPPDWPLCHCRLRGRAA